MTWHGIKDTHIEGKLKAIKKVDIRLNASKDQDEDSKSHVITSLEIETNNGIEELEFHGLIFPDSIGHRVKYSRRAHQTPPEDDGTYLCWGMWYDLDDLNIPRSYATYVVRNR